MSLKLFSSIVIAATASYSFINSAYVTDQAKKTLLHLGEDEVSISKNLVDAEPQPTDIFGGGKII